MFSEWRKRRNRARLRDEKFSFLFEEDSSDEVVVFDTETTGLDRKRDEIISIGAVKIRGNRVLLSEKFHILIQSQKMISSSEAVKIHRIRECDLENAMTVEEGIEKFLYFIGSRPLVGYYLEFDIAMVNRTLRDILGIYLPNRQIEVSGIYYDKKAKKSPNGNVDLRFDSIAKDLNIPLFGKHDALNDSIMTAMIYLKLTRK
jgi:DNA polymerase-3 subunit epsilon